MVVTTGPILQAADFGFTTEPAAELDRVARSRSRKSNGRHVGNVLRHTDGNVSQTARILGIDRVTLYNKIKKYNIKRPHHEEQEET